MTFLFLHDPHVKWIFEQLIAALDNCSSGQKLVSLISPLSFNDQSLPIIIGSTSSFNSYWEEI